jgi:hypothetical protein
MNIYVFACNIGAIFVDTNFYFYQFVKKLNRCEFMLYTSDGWVWMRPHQNFVRNYIYEEGWGLITN